MRQNRPLFEGELEPDEKYDERCTEMLESSMWPDRAEIVAAAHLLGVQIWVYQVRARRHLYYAHL
jgi:hypothetical protein